MKVQLLFLFLMCGLMASAQSLTFSAKSGDAELDASLTEMNATAKTDLGGFKAKISADFKLTTAKIDIMLGTMTPADVFMNAQVAIIIGKPVDDVILVYNKNKGKGWGVIAKELGIKPGSKEFHQLKDSTKVKNRELKNKVKPAPKSGAVDAGKSKGKGKGKK